MYGVWIDMSEKKPMLTVANTCKKYRWQVNLVETCTQNTTISAKHNY